MELKKGFERSEVLTALSTETAGFWIVAPCRLVEVYRLFRGLYCLIFHSDEGGSKYV
jgi:hypothetical protein